MAIAWEGDALGAVPKVAEVGGTMIGREGWT